MFVNLKNSSILFKQIDIIPRIESKSQDFLISLIVSYITIPEIKLNDSLSMGNYICIMSFLFKQKKLARTSEPKTCPLNHNS